MYFKAELWWCIPLIPVLRRKRQVDLRVWGQPGLYSKLQDSQGYREKSCLKKKKKKRYFKISHLCIYVWEIVYANGGTCVQVRGKLWGLSSLSSHGFWEPNSVYQARWQVLLPLSHLTGPPYHFFSYPTITASWPKTIPPDVYGFKSYPLGFFSMWALSCLWRHVETLNAFPQ